MCVCALNLITLLGKLASLITQGRPLTRHYLAQGVKLTTRSKDARRSIADSVKGIALAGQFFYFYPGQPR